MSTLELNKPLVISSDGINPIAAPNLFDGTNAIAANRFSVPFLTKYHDTLGLQVSAPATGTPNGSIALQASNDISQLEGSNGYPDANTVNWSALSFWDDATASWIQSKAFAGANSFLFTLQVHSARWLRMVWTNTSGSALLTARLQVKSNGGR